jgi:hypothetical protein
MWRGLWLGRGNSSCARSHSISILKIEICGDLRSGKFFAEGENEMSEVVGDPGKFAGASEHSHQVALMAAVAQYAFHFRKKGSEFKLKALFDEDRIASGYADAQSMFDEGERMERIGCALEWMHAIPNGGTRGGDKRSASIAGANMKAEGAKAGVSDLHLPVARQGYQSFYIEMKAPGKIKPMARGRIWERTDVARDQRAKLTGESLDQILFSEFVIDEGHLYSVFDNWHDALRAVMWYLGFTHTKAWALPE